MVAGGVFPAAGAIHNYFRGIVHEGRAGWVGIFENPNELAYSLVILIPIAAALSMRQRLMLRIVLFAIIGLYLYAIYITFSRGGIIGLAVVLTTLALTQRSTAARAGLVVILVLLFFVVIVYWNRDDGFTNLSQDFTVRQRLATIEAGIAMFLDRPISGVGIGCSIVAWPLYSPTHVQFHGALHNHNTIVQALSETGLLGFIPFGLMFLSSLTDTRRLSRLPFGDVRITALIRAFEVAIYGFLACGMSGGYVLSWFPYILVALVAASKRLSFRVRSHESSA
jgi:O-antigen ligase